MSLRARRHRKTDRRLCPCGRRAQYYSHARGAWRWMRDHPLCTACYRAEVDAHRARRLAHQARRRRSARWWADVAAAA